MENKKIVIDRTHKNHTLKHDGLKSIFYINNDLVVTDFGEKNKANIRYVINAKTKEVTPYPGENERIAKIDEVQDNTIKFLSSVMPQKASVDANRPDKYCNGLRKDLLDIKKELEIQFFGKEYNDTLHVQIAYNLLDIQKILSLHVGNVVNSVMQLMKKQRDSKTGTDLIGTTFANLKFENYWDKYGEDCIKRKKEFFSAVLDLFDYNRYFDSIFYTYKFNEKKEEIFKPENEKANRWNFYIIQILSFFRQFSEHVSLKNSQDTRVNNLELFFQNSYGEGMDIHKLNKSTVASEIINEDITTLKEKFLKNSEKNLYILSQILSDDNLVEKYIDYRFCENNIKNLGLNVKKIREGLLKEKNISPNVKQKVNLCVDFYLWNYFVCNKKEKDSIVQQLRECTSNDKKEKIYQSIINKMCFVDGIISNVEKNISDKNVEYNIDKTKVTKKFEQLKVSTDLAKYVYVMTKFMDRKEINELLTSIVNKLSNIESLIDVAKASGNWVNDFKEEKFGTLNNISLFVKDFELVLKLGLMKSNLSKEEVRSNDSGNGNAIGIQLYLDAINIFSKEPVTNISDSDVQIIKKTFDTDGKKSETKMKTIGEIDEQDLKTSLSNNSSPEKSDDYYKSLLLILDHKIRNFLVNSVLNNRRFIYLLKNINPRYCRNIIENENLVKFILMKEDLPDSIIESYYRKITKTEQTVDRAIMVDTIYKSLKNVSLDTFFEQRLTLHKDKRGFGTENKDVSGNLIKNKELITLYLTICYLFVKGMVHTNSVYMLAWSVLERDYYYLCDKERDIPERRYFALVDKKLSELKIYLDDNKSSDDKEWLKQHREIEQNKKSYRKKLHDYGYLNNDREECRILLDIENPIINKLHEEKKKEDPKAKRMPGIFRKNRNSIAHFNVINYCFKNNLLSKIKMSSQKKFSIMNSYFGIYNFVLQNKFIDDFEETCKRKFPFPAKESSLDKGFYDKNLIKIMYMPFAYNLARYKNLTIEDLFNDRYPVKGE